MVYTSIIRVEVASKGRQCDSSRLYDTILRGDESGNHFELAGRAGLAGSQSLSCNTGSGREDFGALSVERVTRGLEFGQGALYAEDVLDIDRGRRRPKRISHIVRQTRARRRAAATTVSPLDLAAGSGGRRAHGNLQLVTSPP